jgi:hypothetical protein
VSQKVRWIDTAIRPTTRTCVPVTSGTDAVRVRQAPSVLFSEKSLRNDCEVVKLKIHLQTAFPSQFVRLISNIFRRLRRFSFFLKSVM